MEDLLESADRYILHYRDAEENSALDRALKSSHVDSVNAPIYYSKEESKLTAPSILTSA